MEILELKAERRSETGTRACQRLRNAGRIPGVLYGHKEETVPLVMVREDLERTLRARARTLKLDLDGEKERVVLKEVQHDALGDEILHVDFARISAHELITLRLEVRLQGIAKGVKEGGVLDQQLQEVEVECPADEIPERITVRVQDLGLDETIRIRDIDFPGAVRPKQDADLVVATVRRPEEEEEVPAEPVEALKEPEVITAREKKEEEEA